MRVHTQRVMFALFNVKKQENYMSYIDAITVLLKL